jgi:hypothetical protein
MPKAAGLAQTHKLMGLADSLSRITHFNTEEVQCRDCVFYIIYESLKDVIQYYLCFNFQCRLLIMFHQKMVACNGPLDRLRFRDVLHVTFEITDDVMLDLTFKAFDRDNDGVVMAL